MNLKPFNLEKALAGDPVVTRDGKQVTDIAIFNSLNDKRNLFAVIDGQFYQFTKNGSYIEYEKVEYCLDLFMAPKIVKKSGWINIYPYAKSGFAIFNTKDDADKGQCPVSKRVACTYIEWEEEE